MSVSTQPQTRPDTKVEQDRASEGKMLGAPTMAAFQSEAHKRGNNFTDKIAANDASAGYPTAFRPLLIDRSSGDKAAWKEILNVNFKVDSLFSYYNMLRTTGYLAQALFPTFVSNLGDAMVPEATIGEDTHFRNKLSESMRPLADGVKNAYGAIEPAVKKTPILGEWHERNFGEHLHKDVRAKNAAHKSAVILESGIFTTLAVMECRKELNSLVDNCRLALGAELGKHKEDVTWKDLFNTDNPLIETESSRLMWKAISRIGTGLGFSVGLRTGLVMMATTIGAERTVFYKKSAYDDTIRMINDVQFNHLEGDIALEQTANNIQRVLQSIQVDHSRKALMPTDMHELRPVILEVAQDILDKKIGVEALIGIIGGGILIPGEPERSAGNYAYLREHEFEGITQNAIAIRQEHNLPEGSVWPRHRFEGSDYHAENIANSARPEKLLSERLRAEERQTHIGVSSR